MPIIVKDFTWEENDSMLFVTVPLKGVRPHKIDITHTEEYLKISYPPYLFECFLAFPVIDDKSVAQIGNGTVLFKLEKETSGLWSTLQHEDIGDKEKLKKKRLAAIDRLQEKSKKSSEEKETRKREINKFGVKQQMQLEQEIRQNIENVKKAEIDQAHAELEAWKEEQKQQALQEKKLLEVNHFSENGHMEANVECDAALNEKSKHSDEQLSNNKRNEQETRKNDLPSTVSKENLNPKEKKSKPDMFTKKEEIAPLRQSGRIDVTFTERVFPTAARESTHDQEEEWLKKQAEARRVIDIADSELSEHEKDPVWLRDKGNEFFKAGNYKAALNVFSHAVRLNCKMASIYSNRAACHLKLRNFIKCIEDVERALELLKPPVPQNATSRIKAHIRRGTAFCELELYAEGLLDYEAALKIDPSNDQLKEDCKRIRDIIQGPLPS